MNAGNKKQNTPSTHHPRRRNVTTLMVGLKKRSHTQKSHPKVVNPRDIAGERNPPPPPKKKQTTKKQKQKQTNKQTTTTNALTTRPCRRSLKSIWENPDSPVHVFVPCVFFSDRGCGPLQTHLACRGRQSRAESAGDMSVVHGPPGAEWGSLAANHLVGLVVKASASRAGGRGFESR